MKQAVIGLGFGDEGKGLVTDYLCSLASHPLVVRFSGGQQAGHTVVLDGKRHVFSNFGAGTLRGATTFWSKTCTFDPVGVMNELEVLKSLGCTPLLIIHPDSPVTTPFDKYQDQNSPLCRKHGTCGVGVGQTWQREADHYHIRVRDLLSPTALEIKLKQLKNHYYKKDVNCDIFLEDVKSIREDLSKFDGYFDMRSHWSEVQDGNIIFEGSQGVLLDQRDGFFPNVTRSNVGLNGLEGVFLNGLVFVTRAYQTRHGNGPMTGTEIPIDLKEDKKETNQTNQYQGEFRKSILDLDLLSYAIDSQKKYQKSATEVAILAITCLDHLNEYKFLSEGKVVEFSNEDNFIKAIADILRIETILMSHSPESKHIEERSFNFIGV